MLSRRKFLVSACAAVVAPTLPPQILENNAIFRQVGHPCGSLDALQAQVMEHMCTVLGIPVVKLLGIQPAGLNASSEGELRTFYDWILAMQEKMIRPNLTVIIDFAMLNLSEHG